jgi:hypothetical protein
MGRRLRALFICVTWFRSYDRRRAISQLVLGGSMMVRTAIWTLALGVWMVGTANAQSDLEKRGD